MLDVFLLMAVAAGFPAGWMCASDSRRERAAGLALGIVSAFAVVAVLIASGGVRA